MDTCAICLDDIKPDHICKTLSCYHKYHFICYKKLVYSNNNLFVYCPLCREMNTNVDMPFKDNHKRNILIMCHSGVGKVRCICETTSGRRCRNKSSMMNYGMCHIHNKTIIPKEYYELYSKYFYHILSSNYDWLTILYLLDVGKKIMLKFLKKNDCVTKIIQYYYRYLNDTRYRDEKSCSYMNGIYEYYDLDKVSKSWLDYCVNKNIII